MIKKILSIDGGGIKGVFPLSFLSTIEEVTGKKISDYFDLIVGTSTGGIIALGIGAGFSAKELLEFYEKLGPDVFVGNRYIKFLRSMGVSKYSNKALKNSLFEKFGDKKLGESKNRLVIPSLNLENGEVHVYKTAHHERFQRDYKENIVDIALATSAAPTYFPTHTSVSGTPLVDGGLWANNPAGLAVVEAIGILEWPRDQLKVLSIGCTDEPLNIKRARNHPAGLFYWGTRIVKLFMSAQSSASYGTAQLLAGHSNITRINPVVSSGKFGLDVVKEIKSLKGLGETEARKALPNIELFFTDKVDPFIPKHQLL
ncbi:MAG: CBASS cGAMP-activated phospholipase [Candidatus Parcubacteria bacterium]|jgi:patatin-like phospholipase/acyl hydrolase|nr:MAG: CBASS cGAMP-activated phospholipase [Candidatus Parcubacteria bacterium]